MTTTDTNLNQLIINEMTQAQYDTITANQNELYIITDGVIQSTDVINALGYTPVNKAGDTMTGNLSVASSAPFIVIKNSDEIAGTTPASQMAKQLSFQDSSGATVGYVQNVYNTNGSRVTILNSRNADCTANTRIEVGFDANGNAYATAPTPASTSNGTNIATTEFCDGNWTSVSASSSQVVSSVSLNYSSNYSISLASILPTNDTYEIIVTGKVTTGTTSGNYAQVRLSVTGFPASVLVCRCRTRSNSAVEAEGTATILYTKGTSTLSLERSTDSNLKGTADLWILAYRKVR